MILRYFLSIALVLPCLVPAVAGARMGETLAQCVKRYGPAVEEWATKENTRWFRANGFVMEVTLRNDVCVAISYMKGDGSEYLPKPMSPKEIAELLSKNGRGLTWEKSDKVPGDWWFTPNGEYGATFIPRTNQLMIFDSKYVSG